MREIVTLQFGERSNYLGTHFWNTQVSEASYSYTTHYSGPQNIPFAN